MPFARGYISTDTSFPFVHNVTENGKSPCAFAGGDRETAAHAQRVAVDCSQPLAISCSAAASVSSSQMSSGTSASNSMSELTST